MMTPAPLLRQHTFPTKEDDLLREHITITTSKKTNNNSSILSNTQPIFKILQNAFYSYSIF